MELDNIIQMGAQLFKSQLDSDQDGQVEAMEIASALTQLLSNNQGQFDLGSLVSKMQSGGLMELAASWLGDGPNSAIDSNQLAQLFNNDKIAAFAQQLGLSPDQALKGLSAALPSVVDKSSSGGSLLDMVGGVSGAINLASKLFNR